MGPRRWVGLVCLVPFLTAVPSAFSESQSSTSSAPSVLAQAPAGAPASSGLVTIESDTQAADNQTGIVTAKGNVRITYPDKGMVATSRQAQYFTKEGRLVLSGDVDVIDADGQRIRAERLVYFLDQHVVLQQVTIGAYW